jgi:acetyltransferase-like isoleucine patch superfamily enzyme
MQTTDAPHSTHHGSQRSASSAEVDTELRRLAKDHERSGFAKYCALAVGQTSLWALVKYELMVMLLAPMPGAVGYALRQKLYPRLLGHVGRGVTIGRNVTIRHPHRIHIDDHVMIDDNVVLDGKGEGAPTLHIQRGAIIGRNTILSCKGGTLTIGEQANISVNCTLISETTLRIEQKVLLAGHCYLVAGGNHGLERVDVPILDQPLKQQGGITVQRHSWLGAAAVVLDGVMVGHDAVVAAGAVVTRSPAPYTIVGGVPAKVLRNRIEERSDG